MLLITMERRGEGVLDGPFVRDLGKMLLAAAVTGLAAVGTRALLASLLPAGKAGELLCLGGCALAGVAVYALLTLALGLEEARLGLVFVKRLGKRG